MNQSTVTLIASGDLRESANQVCWPAQQEMEKALTDTQILDQCRMYVAALRIADDFGCDVIGIQYQQGLKDLSPASDLVEGMLNDSVRPPVKSRDGLRELYPGRPLTHFNEVDECAGLDGLLTDRVHRALGQPVENTLHDLPLEETQRRWQATTPQWPIMHAVLQGVARDQMMARHKANHIQVVYADSDDNADVCMHAKAVAAAALGMEVSLCGV